MRRKGLGYLAAALAGCLLLSGCEASADSSTEASRTERASDSVFSGESVAVKSASGGGEVDSGGTETGGEGMSVEQKLIVTRNMTVETQQFDEFYEAVRSKTAELGGYLENTSVSGQKEKGDRSAYLAIRVPADRLEELTEEARNGATVLSMDEYTNDVTLEYVDVESRLTALRTERDSLLRLIEQADKLEDIISLQTRLTDVNYEIESYESRLRAMDNQVEYSALYLDIQEVERERSESGRQGFWAEVKDGLSNSFYGFGSGLRSFGVAFFVALPYLAALAAAAFAIAILVKRISRKRKEKEDQE